MGRISETTDGKRFESIAQVEAYICGMAGWVACDAGRGCFPRFYAVEAPKVGDAVSKAFNGDSYAEGEIIKVSKTLRRVETSTGEVFFRVRKTGAWRSNRTWWLVSGHEEKRNPSF